MGRLLRIAGFGVGVVLLVLGPSGRAGTGSAVADFSFSPESPDINTEVTLDGSASYSPQGAITRYEWDFDGDGKYEESFEDPVLVHLFDESGSFPVTLRVTDSSGQQATVTKVVPVRPAPVKVRRRITAPLPPNRVPAGSSFQVIVTIEAHEVINGLGLDEDLPEGWRASLVEADGAAFKASQLQWLWFQTLSPGRHLKVIYDVTVPEGTPAKEFEIKGVISSFSPRFEIAIPGDRKVRVF